MRLRIQELTHFLCRTISVFNPEVGNRPERVENREILAFSGFVWLIYQSLCRSQNPALRMLALRGAAAILIQTHKRFKRTLIYYDIENTMQIFREIPFFRPQNDT